MDIGAGKYLAATAGSVLLALLIGMLGPTLGYPTRRRGASMCAALALGLHTLYSFAPIIWTHERHRAPR